MTPSFIEYPNRRHVKSLKERRPLHAIIPRIANLISVISITNWEEDRSLKLRSWLAGISHLRVRFTRIWIFDHQCDSGSVSLRSCTSTSTTIDVQSTPGRIRARSTPLTAWFVVIRSRWITSLEMSGPSAVSSKGS